MEGRTRYHASNQKKGIIMRNLRYNIQLEVVTPLSVGAGNQNEWVKGADFVQLNNRLYVLDLRKMIENGVDINMINQCFINQDENGICQLLGNRLEDMARFVFDLPTRTDNPVKTFLRTQLFDRPLVPGSSIKGSIRSALFNYLKDEREKKDVEVFGSMKVGDDFMRFLKIGDVEMRRTILVNTKLFNLHTNNEQEWTGGWKQGFTNTSDNFRATGFNTLYECVPPDERGLGTITMAAMSFQQLLEMMRTPHSDKKVELMEEGIEGLFCVINDVTKNYLRKELNFFKHYEAERSDEIVECINDLINMIPDDNSSCLMKMSAGVGFHSITGDWQYDSFINTGVHKNGKKKYKSRKIADFNNRLMLMGFVRLSVMQEEKAVEEMASIDKEHQEMMEEIRTSPQRRVEMLKRVEQEKIERLEQEKKLKQLQAEYDELISKAKELHFNNKYKEAKEMAQRAESLWPEGPDHQSLLEEIEKFIKRQEEERKADDDKRKKYQQPLSVVLEGKTTTIGNILGHLTKWLKEEANTIRDEEIAVLATAFNKLPNKEARKLKGFQARVASLIGEENAAAVFAKLEEIKKT